MAYMKEQLEAELKRKLGAETTGAPTAPVVKPAGRSAAAFLSDAQQQEGSRPSFKEQARAVGSGATFGLTDVVGSALPAAVASFGSGKGFGEVYKDIRGTEDYKSEQAREQAPELMEALELGGAAASLGGAGLKMATRAAMNRGAARVGGKGADAATVASSAPSKPRFTGAQVAAGEHLPKAVAKAGGKMGKVKDVAKGVASNLGGGAVVGTASNALGGDAETNLSAAATSMLINNPLGRWGLSRAMSKMFGDKARVLTYLGSHPATRKSASKFSGALRDKVKQQRLLREARRRAKNAT